MNRKVPSKLSKFRQPLAWFLALAWAGVIFFISSQPASALPFNLGEWSYFVHFCVYWILAVLLVGALNVPWRKSWMMAVVAMVLASLYGITDEFHQYFVDGRCAETLDWVVDTAGGTIGALAGTWILTVVRLYRKAD
ncbi:MAG: VanZ family protein [Actinobacteria bacterium]|nr:VanZ family protein [Actinomycetota bacterium]